MTSIGDGAFNNCPNVKLIVSSGSYAHTYAINNSIPYISAVASGTCGDGVSWVLDDNGVLTISGSGAMTSSPWIDRQLGAEVASMVIENGVTGISAGAFSGCTNLTGVTIPGSVTVIGDSAFSGCTGLTVVTIPAGMVSIGDGAFSGSGLERIFINGYDTSLGAQPFPATTTLYCYEFSNADFWAEDNGYEPVYLDTFDWDSIRTVTLNTQSATLAPGETIQLTAQVSPDDDQPTVVWTSSDETVAVVDQNGLVTACNKGGQAIVTATEGSVSASAAITVDVELESFDVPAEIWLVTKTDYAIPLTNLSPEGAEAVFTWTSADDLCARVDENGVVSGRKVGETTVTVTADNGIARTVVVHICYPVTAVAFDAAELDVPVGTDQQLTAHATTRDGVYDNKLVTFASSDETVATVDQNGTVHALAYGTATIFADASELIYGGITIHVVCSGEHEPVADEAVAPTCAATGLTEGSHCAVCGRVITAQEEVPVDPDAHDWHVSYTRAGGSVTRSMVCAHDASHAEETVRELSFYMLPTGLERVEDEAFAGSAVEAVIVPDGCTSIGNGAFAGCVSLQYIYIPDGVTVATDAFAGCGDVWIDRGE